ncbi:MAG: InlB B-repeat-containing protein [Clostridia bacterium]|nr:InlB B-repeat-containing protein [Clostridia bacterium]
MKIRSAAILFLSMTALLFSLCACSKCEHVDADDDLHCDFCDDFFHDGKDIVDPPACEHRDANDDGKCDNCQADYSDGKDLSDPPACQHRDANDDGKCDECQTDYTDGKDIADPPVCGHRDSDDNGKCDKCEAAFSDADEVAYEVIYYGLEGAENPNPDSFIGALTLQSPTRDWYVFTGWFTDEGRTEKKTALTKNDGSTVLYAGWALATYTAEYYADGVLIHTQSFNRNTQGFTPPTPTEKAGYNAAWQSTDIRPENLTVHAVYTPKTYTIVYNNIEGATTDSPTSYQTGEEIVLKDARKNGYRFDGWKDASGASVTRIEAGTHENITLYASFSVATYTLKYENTCGAELSALPTEYNIFSPRILLPAISAKGYTFEGWQLNGQRVDAIESGSFGDLTLTAIMTPASFSIVLESAYGTLENRSYTVRYGESFSLPVLSAEGHVFLGWYDNSGTSGTCYTNERGESLSPYAHFSGRVLYARFAPSQCVISYDTMGGDPIASIFTDYGSAFDPSVIPTRAGAVFAGWFDATLTTPYTASTVIKENTVVYAKWVESIPISTAQELIAIRENPTANYHLTQDINLGGEVFAPIPSFSGILEGNGHTVRNFTLSATEHAPHFGFFARMSGTLQNLSFADFTLNVSVRSTAEMQIGAFAGANEGRIYNCSLSDGVFQVTYTVPTHFCHLQIGAIAGASFGTVEDSENTVSLKTLVHHTFNTNAMFDEHDSVNYNVGGIVGYNAGTVQGCVFDGSIDHSAETTAGGDRFLYDHSQIGGLIGENRGTVKTSYATVAITATHPSRHGMGTTFIRLGGGIGSNRAIAENCYATGTLEAHSASDLYLGGFVGESYTQSASIANCYARVSVVGHSAGGIGGFAGYLDAPVQNCYATGEVGATKHTSVGGFVGYNQTGATVSKCYCSGSVTSSGGETGFFAGHNGGVFFKCYYMRGAALLVNGQYITYTVEHNTVEGKLYSVLWSEEFLKDSLYWDGEGWIILANEDPILEWEISIDHDYEKTVVEPTCEDFGFTVYSCKDCSRYFIMDVLSPHGHDLTEETEVISPTCTERGYTARYCRRCESVIATDIVDPVGHTAGALSERVEPTCTEAGYALYHCEICKTPNAVRVILPANGHTEVTVPAKAQTCTEEGYTERSYCSVCFEVIKEKKVLAPHFFGKITEITPATCTGEGEGSAYCPVCDHTEILTLPSLGHEDKNKDARCDRCTEFMGALSGVEFIEIHTAEDLEKIKDAPGKAYKLMASITLPEGFSPIGSIASPFTGYFDGNGFTVTLTGKTDAAAYGLFGYNEGVITSLTVSGGAGTAFTYNSVNAVLGIVCAYNDGLIISCKTEGIFSVTVSAYYESSARSTSRGGYSFTFGGIAGVNGQMGEIRGCDNGAILSFTASNRAVCTATKNIYAILDKLYKSTLAEGSLTLTLGLVAGRNEGLLSRSVISGETLIGEPEEFENALPSAASLGYFGHARAITDYIFGVICGVNTGKMDQCLNDSAVYCYVPADEKISRVTEEGLLYSASVLYRFRQDGLAGADLNP